MNYVSHLKKKEFRIYFARYYAWFILMSRRLWKEEIVY